jgi:hypothetical protein
MSRRKKDEGEPEEKPVKGKRERKEKPPTGTPPAVAARLLARRRA